MSTNEKMRRYMTEHDENKPREHDDITSQYNRTT